MSQYFLLKSDGESDNPNVGLTSDNDVDGGVLGADSYTTNIDTKNRVASVRWYDTSTLYNNRSHPENADQFWQFFNDERDDVSFGGIEMEWEQALAWGDSWNGTSYPKPSYLPADGFSFHFIGEIYAPETGTYQFGVDGDDAVDVYINGERIAQWYGGHGPSRDFSHNGSVDLSEGWHKIVSRHEEGGGGEAWAVAWNKPSDSSFSVIPNSSYRSPDQSVLDVNVSSTTSGSSLSSSSPFTDTQATSLTDQKGSLTTTSTVPTLKTGLDVLELSTSETTTSFSNALLTIGNGGVSTALSSSSSNSNSFITTSSFVDRTALLNTTTVANALISAIVHTDRKSIGDTSTTSISDKTIVINNTTNALGDALSTLIATEQLISTNTNSADSSFGTSNSDSIEKSIFTTETVGTFSNSSVTSVGVTENLSLSSQISTTIINLFASVSPTTFAIIQNTGQGVSNTIANSIVENASLLGLSPTLSLLINVEKGNVGIEGSFADSLSATVGANTSIKVSKTIGNTDAIDSAVLSKSVDNAVRTDFTATPLLSEELTSVVFNATYAAASISDILSDVQTTSSVSSQRGEALSSSINSDPNTTSITNSERTSVNISKILADANTEAIVDALSESVTSLVESGVVETDVGAAAIVANVLADTITSPLFTETDVTATRQELDTEIRRRTPNTTSKSRSDSIEQQLSSNISDINTESNVNGAVVELITSIKDGNIDTESLADGLTTVVNTYGIETIIEILITVFYGGNNISVLTEQNDVLIKNNGKNNVKIL